MEVSVAVSSSWTSVILTKAGSVLSFQCVSVAMVVKGKKAASVSQQNIASASSEAQRLTPL